jgi:hypothetical protein
MVGLSAMVCLHVEKMCTILRRYNATGRPLGDVPFVKKHELVQKA